MYQIVKVVTDFIVKNVELSTDIFLLVPIFLSRYIDKKMGTFLNKDTKVDTL